MTKIEKLEWLISIPFFVIVAMLLYVASLPIWGEIKDCMFLFFLVEGTIFLMVLEVMESWNESMKKDPA